MYKTVIYCMIAIALSLLLATIWVMVEDFYLGDFSSMILISLSLLLSVIALYRLLRLPKDNKEVSDDSGKHAE